MAAFWGILFSFFELLHSVGVLESVQCVLGTVGIRCDIAYHDGAAVASEGIFQDHSQFAASEGSVIFILV